MIKETDILSFQQSKQPTAFCQLVKIFCTYHERSDIRQQVLLLITKVCVNVNHELQSNQPIMPTVIF